MKITDQALFWITPFIVAIVLINQFYRVQTYDLSTWQGGGFGMFSSIDSIYSRFFKIYLKIDNEIIPVSLKKDFEKLVVASRAEPTQENLQRLAMRIYEANWVQSGNFRYDATVEGNYRPVLEINRDKHISSQPKQRIKIDGINLELWKTRFDSATNTVTTYKHTEYVYPVSK